MLERPRTRPWARPWGGAFVALALILAQNILAQDEAPTLPRTDFVIVGARVEVGDGRVVTNGTVVVRDGRIQSVSEGGRPPEGLTVVEAQGMTLYPGFIDAYATRGVATPPTGQDGDRPDALNTAPPFMWEGNRKGITANFRTAANLELDNEQRAYEAGFTTALLVPNRGSIRGTAAVVNLLPKSIEDRVLVEDFGMAMSFRGGTGAGYPGNILGIIALMRQKLYDANYWAQTIVADGEELPEWRQDLEALRRVVYGTMPAVFVADVDREIYRAFSLGDEFKFPVIIAGGRDAYVWTDMLKERRASVILTANLPNEPSLASPPANAPPADVIPMEFRRERHERWVAQARGPATLVEAGIPIALSTEGDNLANFHRNLRRLLQHGLSRDAALKALTSGAAQILKIDDRVGTVTPGKMANLVLMDGDFANENTKVKSVWIDGRLVFKAEAAR